MTDSTPDGQQHPEELSLLTVLVALLRQRRLIVACVAAGALIALLRALLSPPLYVSVASFMPHGTDKPTSQLALMAGQFGISVPQGGGSSPQFYAELLDSRGVLTAVWRAPLAARGDGAQQTIGAFVAAQEGIESTDTTAALRWLRDATATGVDEESGLVEAGARTKWPRVSFSITSSMIGAVNRFNLETHQSAARAERQFIQARMEEAQAALRSAEQALQQFLQANRQFESSSHLQFEYDRLQRNVLLRQQVYASMAQGYEDARISEVRNTPVITLVEQPNYPRDAEPRKLLTKLLVGVVAGAILGIIAALVREFFRVAAARRQPEMLELKRLGRESFLWLRRGRRHA
jgi:uncharacterized protein involved in exopolysaccharide biosynthesis